MRLAGNTPDAEELLQETCVRACQRISTLDDARTGREADHHAADAATRGASGSMGFAPPPGARWPAELPSDLASVVDFGVDGLTVFTRAERVEALHILLQTAAARDEAVVTVVAGLAETSPTKRA